MGQCEVAMGCKNAKGWGNVKCSIARGWENVTLQGDRKMRHCKGNGNM